MASRSRLAPHLDDGSDSDRAGMTPLKLGDDTDEVVMVPEEVAKEMERLASMVRLG